MTAARRIRRLSFAHRPATPRPGGPATALTVLLAGRAAAALHAGWNGLVRVGASRAGTMMVLSGVQGVIGLVVVTDQPVPAAPVWPWIAASGVIQTAYKLFLTLAYEHGDLGRVYPLARGTAPMITLV